jgi:hypothetical protein
VLGLWARARTDAASTADTAEAVRGLLAAAYAHDPAIARHVRSL